MKMTANLNRPALYWGWSIAGAISLYILVFEVTERTTKKGQPLLFPEVSVDTYWLSLDVRDAHAHIAWSAADRTYLYSVSGH